MWRSSLLVASWLSGCVPTTALAEGTEDGDGDRVSDAVDRCPTEPETVNQHLDEDGCPDDEPVRRLPPRRVVLTETVAFEPGQATPPPGARATLDRVVALLGESPELRFRIVGHSDSEGSDEANLRLSRERADHVREYLLARGVAPDRLQSTGFGEAQPIESNRSPEGRAKNRRVEFIVIPP